MTAAPWHTGAGTGRPTRCDPQRPRGAAGTATGRSLRQAAWTGGLVLAARALHATGGAYRIPTDSWRSAGEWLGTATPLGMAVGVLRLAAIAAVWYLLAATVVALAADRAGRPGLARAVARLTPALVRRTVIRGGGVGLAVGVLVGSALHSDTAPAGPGTPAPMLLSLPALPGPSGDPDGTATMTRQPPTPGAPGEATMIRLAGDGGMDREPEARDPEARDPEARGRPAAGPPGAAPRPGGSVDRGAPDGGSSPAVSTSTPGSPDTGAPTSGDTWVVAPGDSFWSIATEVIVEAGGARRPRDRDVVPYWRDMIAANRDRLVVPDDPDILVPGQRLLIPAPRPVANAT
ncbi:MAG TPA: LysM domain-containing protein [Acidimicrobiales bacterium]